MYVYRIIIIIIIRQELLGGYYSSQKSLSIRFGHRLSTDASVYCCVQAIETKLKEQRPIIIFGYIGHHEKKKKRRRELLL